MKSCLAFVVFACVIYQISAWNFDILRKDQGTDVCTNCKKGILSPRPYPLSLPSLPKPVYKTVCKEQLSFPERPKSFDPIGDVCHCGQQHVRPAPTSRPIHTCLKPKSTCSCQKHQQPEDKEDCGRTVAAPKHFQHFDNQEASIYFETSQKKKAQVQSRAREPADVVSIAIAKRLSNSAKNGISERNLQYGSLKQPIEGTQQEVQRKSPINEELFYDNKRPVLQLQPQIFSESSMSSEEESEEVLKPKKQKAFQPAELDFESIGYKNYQPSNPRYVVVKNSKHSKHENTKRPSKHHHHKSDGSCGCYKDLVVDQSSISEQSMSYESPNEHNSYNVQFSS